jgi:hypothetical protein
MHILPGPTGMPRSSSKFFFPRDEKYAIGKNGKNTIQKTGKNPYI